ncbi:MAG: hypothetical protein ACXAEU_16320 [Candidatus Hodarchaeales archaeon]
MACFGVLFPVIIFAGTDPVLSESLLYNTGMSVVFFKKLKILSNKLL